MENNQIDIARAWKDAEYRESLTAEQLVQLPENPAGDAALDEDELDNVAGGFRSTNKVCYSARTAALSCGC